MKKHKIIFIHPGTELYGSDRILLNTLRVFYESNYEITVFLPKDGVLISEIEKISTTIFIEINKNIPVIFRSMRLGYIMQLPGMMYSLRKVLVQKNPDIVYLNTLAVSLCLIAAHKRFVIIHIHEIFNAKIVDFIFSKLTDIFSDCVIAVSQHVNSFISKYATNKSKYTVIHNGIPDIAFLDIAHQNKSELFGKVKFLLPGRIMPEKGQWFLIDALKLVDKKYLDKSMFQMLGSVPPFRPWLKDELCKYIIQARLSDYITITDFVSNPAACYAETDIVLVPSIMEDPFPTTVIEAMCFSKPVIATDHGGASEIVTDNITGFLVSPNDTHTFANLIMYVIDNQEQMKSIGKNSRDYYMNNLTYENYKSGILSLMHKFNFY